MNNEGKIIDEITKIDYYIKISQHYLVRFEVLTQEDRFSISKSFDTTNRQY